MTPPSIFLAPSGRPAWRLSVLVAAVALTACADMSGINSQATLRDPATLGLAAPPAAPVPAAVPADWWRGFGDAQLNTLVEQALAQNPSLKVAQARLARAQAVTEVADAALLPQVNGAVDLTRQRYTETGAIPAPLAGSIRNSGTLQLNASWELDFFGKYRAALDSALGTVQAAQADTDAARVLLASNVARTYLQLVRIHAQLAVAERTLAQREETMHLVRDRVGAGLDTRLELHQSEGSLPEARQQIEALHEQSALLRNTLGALVADQKMALALDVPALTAIKSIEIPAQIPADLLGQRADIAAARWRVESASKDVVNAKTQFYPNINLVAFAGLSSIGLNRLIGADSLQWGVGPALRLPIFEGGRLRANLRGKTSDLDAAIESYNSSVLDAVHDVADQVASARSITRQQTEQRSAQASAESAYGIAVQRYQAGLGNYLNVLAAETNVLVQRRQAVDLAARALDVQVGLARAVGGGYTAVLPGAVAAQPPALVAGE